MDGWMIEAFSTTVGKCIQTGGVYQLYANRLTLFWHLSPFLPIRMTSPPLLWPALACPWKSYALLRVRVRVQRSSHRQKSSTESMTWVRLLNLHLSTHRFFHFPCNEEIHLADGSAECASDVYLWKWDRWRRVELRATCISLQNSSADYKKHNRMSLSLSLTTCLLTHLLWLSSDLKLGNIAETKLSREGLAGQLEVGSVFTFRVTVLQASGVPPEYADIFCQFK